MHLLDERGAVVSFHDPFVPSIREEEGEVRDGVDLTADILESMDAVVVVTDHRNVDYQLVMDRAQLIIDSRNVMRGLIPTKARVVSLASPSMAGTPEHEAV
jgi:UDP-N-acetyl-D-glucosamine dehydrogenase